MEWKWENKAFSFFNNNLCELFPCHKTEDPENFNCIFCYCPLYVLDDKCGGSLSYNENGVKDCRACDLPHVRDNYGYVIRKCSDVTAIMKDK